MNNLNIMTSIPHLAPFKSISAAYFALIPTSILLMLGLFLVPLLLIPESNLLLVKDIFLGYALEEGVRPEPIEQVRYIFAIVIVPTVFLLSLIAFLNIRLQNGVRLVGVLTVQVLFLMFIIKNAISGYPPNFSISGQGVYTFSPIHTFYQFCCGVIISAVAFIYYQKFKTLNLTYNKLIQNIISYTLAVLVTIVGILPSIAFNLDSFPLTHHLGYTMGEYAAFLNGKTPLVSVFPQYQNILSYLTWPIFQLFGLSITSLSLTMGGLLLTGMMLIYQIFRYCTQNAWLALALYIPFCAISFYTPTEWGVGFNLNTYNYFSGISRYFGLMVTAFFCAKYLLNPTAKRMILLFFIGTIFAINNLDFGIPVLVATLMATLLTTEDGILPSFKNIFRISIIFLFSVMVALSLFFVITLLKSGQFPNWLLIFKYQKIFAFYGFGMFPMPKWGLHWLIFITFMATILVAIWQIVVHFNNKNVLSSQQRLQIGLLIFSGISGSGAFMYFIGRSTWYNLITIFTIFSFALLLLIWQQFLDWKNSKNKFTRQERLVRYMPSLVLVFVYVSMLGHVVTMPSIPGNLIRLNTNYARHLINHKTLEQFIWECTQFVKNNTQQGEKVGIIHQWGYEIANLAQVENVFPFVHPRSMILKSQLDMAMKTFKKANVTKIFGAISIYPDIKKQISQKYSLVVPKYKQERNLYKNQVKFPFYAWDSTFEYWKFR